MNTLTKKEREEFDKWFVPEYGKWKIGRIEALQWIENLLEKRQQEVVEKLVALEHVLSQQEKLQQEWEKEGGEWEHRFTLTSEEIITDAKQKIPALHIEGETIKEVCDKALEVLKEILDDEEGMDDRTGE